MIDLYLVNRLIDLWLAEDIGHGDITSLGFRFGRLAYSCDLIRLPPQSLAALTDLDVWIVDALRYTPHPTHAHVERTLS